MCVYTNCTELSRIKVPQLYARLLSQLYSTRAVWRALDIVCISTKWRRVLVKGREDLSSTS
jgi:hypothetical protein